MKKYIALLIAVIVLSFSLCIPSFAIEERIVTLSDDYKNLYLNGSTYVRADTSMIFYELNDDGDDNLQYGSYYADCPAPTNYNGHYYIKLSDKQHSEIESVDICEVNKKETIFIIIIYFKDGSELHIDFLREDLIDEYIQITSGNTDTYIIDFMWPEGNEVTIDKEKLFIGNKTVIDTWEYEEEFSVFANSPTGGFEAQLGYVFSINDEYYFYYYNSENETEAIKLTDEETLKSIKAGVEKYYNDDYGYLYNNKLTETISKTFFILIFALAPAVIFVASLILAIKSKKMLYKKLLFATSGISVAVIVTFIYIAFTLFNN